MKINTPTKHAELKWILLSLFVHSSLLGAILVFNEDTKKVATPNQSVSIDISIVQIPKQNIQEPKKETVKKVVQEKPKIVKKVVKPKVVKKPLKVKPKIVKKVVKPTHPIEKKEIQQPPITKDTVAKKIQETKEVAVPKEKIVTSNSTKKVQHKKVENPIQTSNIESKSVQRENFIETNFSIIRNKVLANLSYPHIAKKMGFQGITTIELQIDSSGRLLEVKLSKSSGKKILDKAAIAAGLKLKYTTLPKPKNNTTVVLPIVFKIS